MAPTILHSEYPLCTWKPLQRSDELECSGDALYIGGIGPIAQYHCYLDMLWEKGIPYFVRDYYAKEVAAGCVELVPRLSALNSELCAYEQWCSQLSGPKMTPKPVSSPPSAQSASSPHPTTPPR